MQTKNVKRLLANEGICLITHPEVALTLGKSEAIFLQQLHYWLTSDNDMGTTFDGKRWIYNSYKAWAENLRIYSESTIRRAISKLEKIGVIVTQNLNKKKSDHTKWYTINYDLLKSLIPVSSSKKHKRAGESKLDECLLKMNSPPVQNEQFINKENKNNFRDNLSSNEVVASKDSHNSSDKTKQASLEKDLFQQMILIWNQVVEEGKKTVELTSKRISFLKKAFETQFENCLEKWREFCKKIASSKFLMGEIKASFKASLDWVLKFDVIRRILEGDFGVGDRTVYLKDSQSSGQNLVTDIQNSVEPEVIKQFRIALLNRIGEGNYLSWFKSTPISLINGQIAINATSNFTKDHINRVFGEDVERARLMLFHPALQGLPT